MSLRVYKALDLVRLATELGEYDSNVIGMAGEVIAQEHFGMRKAARGKRAVDGVLTVDGVERSVQVKAWSEARIRRYGSRTFFRITEEAHPEHLLVLLVYSSKPHYEVLYNGPRGGTGKLESSEKVRIITFASLVTSAERANDLLTGCGWKPT
jgi:hypothetical protein